MIRKIAAIPTRIGHILLRPKILLMLSFFTLGLGLLIRVNMALSEDGAGGDDGIHQAAIESFLSGISPYEYTVDSYENLESNPDSKGYAYFPAILYIYTFLYKISTLFPLNSVDPMIFFYRLPGIVGFLGVGVFLIFYFYKKDRLAMFFCVLFWAFNYHFVSRQTLDRFDDLPILFTLLALNHLGKHDLKSGAYYSLAVLFKTFPVILFPLFMFKAKKPLHFLFWGFLTALIFSIPFFTTFPDIMTYINGALLVHGDRVVQGRPFLYYLSFITQIELFRVIPFGFYSVGSIFFGWVIILFLKHFRLIKDVYTASILPFVSFYIFTPVLNRTFLLWWIPVFLIGFYNFSSSRKKLPYFYVISSVIWGFLYWYLIQWDLGFHTKPYLD